MSSKGRIGEKISIVVIVLVLLAFLGGFGYLVKTELNGNGKLSYSIKQKTEEKKKENEESKKANQDKDENDITDTSDDKSDDDKTETVEDESKKDETDIQVSGDGKEYKAYPIVTCKHSEKIEGTEVKLKEEYNFYFDTDGTMNWIKYEAGIDYSKYPETYEILFESGFFDEFTKLYSDITVATVISKEEFLFSFEIKPEEFIEDVEDSVFKTKKDLEYDNFEKKITKLGYTCEAD